MKVNKSFLHVYKWIWHQSADFLESDNGSTRPLEVNIEK